MGEWITKTVCQSCFDKNCHCVDKKYITVEQRWVVIHPKGIFKSGNGVWEIRRESLSPEAIESAVANNMRLSLASDITQLSISSF